MITTASKKRREFRQRVVRRVGRDLLFVGATLLVGLAAAWAQTPAPVVSSPQTKATASRTADGKSPKQHRLREGTELKDEQGYFLATEDGRTVFVMGGTSGTRYTVLENLNLERIVSEITRNPTQLEWSVLGTVTEYQGANYLLVRRAVLSRLSSQPNKPGS